LKSGTADCGKLCEAAGATSEKCPRAVSISRHTLERHQIPENHHRIKAFLAAFRKRALLVGIPSSSEQNAEQCFPALCGGLNAGSTIWMHPIY
jgi:hypothetical protein